MARLNCLACLRFELEVNARKAARERRTPDFQYAPLGNTATLEYFLLQLRAFGDAPAAQDHGDENSGEEGNC
jgi:hypothetical protein